MKLGDRPVRIAVAAAGLLPLAVGILDFARDGLGPEPVEEITHRSGEWALRMLLLSLCITPLRRIFGLTGLVPHRRTLGLLAFLYASLHFLTYLALDLEFRPGELAEDLRERPFIAVGFSALVLMTPLALTSTRGWIRRLGRRWRKLHWLVYPAVVLAAVHFVWSAKADWLEPAIYAGVAAALLATRLLPMLGRKRPNYATLPPARSAGDKASNARAKAPHANESSPAEGKTP